MRLVSKMPHSNKNQVYYRVKFFYEKNIDNVKERQKHQIDHLVIDDYFPWNLFYGASLENTNKCGARVVLNLVPLIIFLSRWVLEKGPITGPSYQP